MGDGGAGHRQFAILIALLNWALQQVPAAPAALIFSLFPLLTLLLGAARGSERITAAVLGWALLGEPLPPQLLVALCLIAAGLWLATRPSTGKRQPAPG